MEHPHFGLLVVGAGGGIVAERRLQRSVNVAEYITAKEALARLPVRMAERVFRRRIQDLGLCYKHGHQLSLSEDQLARFIVTLEHPATEPQARRSQDAMQRARALLAERKGQRS